MIQSISNAYTNLAHAQVQQEVQTAVLAQSIDEVERRGASLVDLINVSGMARQQQPVLDPMLGRNVNTFA